MEIHLPTQDFLSTRILSFEPTRLGRVPLKKINFVMLLEYCGIIYAKNEIADLVIIELYHNRVNSYIVLFDWYHIGSHISKSATWV